ncbi:MAG: amidohydrolase family protein [Acidimicrobiia bacterium]
MFEQHLDYPVFDADNHLFDSVMLWRGYAESKYSELFEDDIWLSDRERFLSSAIGRRASRFGEGNEVQALEESAVFRPGASLNKLNPYKNANSPEEREAIIKEFQALAPGFQNRDRRLEVMDIQGIEGAIMFPQADALVIHSAFSESAERSMAAVRAYNRWVDAEWGFSYQHRIFVPAAISLMDVDLALAEVDWALEHGARGFLLPPGPLHGRSPADPMYDPFWARLNEAKVGAMIHLNYTDYAQQGARFSEDPDSHFIDGNKSFTAFQWFSYWGDRPVMETTAALIFHGLFERFPDVRIALSEQGTVWLPYTLRKMDHAFMMGRKGTFDAIKSRPSDTFRKHFLVAPYPEEIVSRPMEVVGDTCLTFGSDFPHGEGLADPAEYANAILGDLTEEQRRKIMRDNLANFLLPAGA